MGLFSFIKKATRSSRRVSIDTTLGNVLIAGGSKKGAESVIRNYAIDSVNKNIGVVVFRDQDNGISSYPSISSTSRMIYEVDCADNSTTEQIDIFSGMSDIEINSYIIKLFDMYSEMDKSKKMSFQNYIALLRSLSKKAGKKVKLDNLADFPIEEVETYNSMYCSGMELTRNDRFLSSIRTEIRELESYFFDFSSNVAGYILSGNKSLEQIFKIKPIIEISLDFSRKPEESTLIMAAIIDAIGRINLSATTVTSVNTIVDGAPNDILINSGLQKLIKSGNGLNVMFTIQDISNLVETSNEWIDYADSYFFFRQNSNKNKEFCSEFFGTYEKQKETVTTGVSNPTFWDRMSGRGSSSKQSSTSITTEKERVYLPEVFAGLPDNQAVYYYKKNNEHMYLNVY